TPLAGNGIKAKMKHPAALNGQPATSVPLDPWGVTTAPDGSVLIAEPSFSRIDRVAPDGTITQKLSVPHAYPGTLATMPDGSLLFSDNHRVWRVDPSGTASPIAGGGPLTLTSPIGLEQRLDGGPAQASSIDLAVAAAPLQDGGVLLTVDEFNVRENILA